MENNNRRYRDDEEGGQQEPPQQQQQQQGGEQQAPYQDKFNPSAHEIIVKGLSFQANEEDVKSFFNKYGTVISVNIEKYYDGNSKGTCFIKYESEQGVIAAQKASGVEFLGRQVWIDKTRPKSERVKEYGGGGYQGGRRRGYGGYNNRGYNNGGGYNNYGGGGRRRGGGYNNRGGGGYYNNNYNNNYNGGGGGGYYGGRGGGGGGYNRRNNRGYNRNRGGGGGPREKVENSKIVFVGNLNYRTERQEIWDYFDKIGKVLDVRVARNPSGSKKGFAHVEFETFEDSRAAMALNGKELGGRELRVDLAAPSRGRRD